MFIFKLNKNGDVVELSEDEKKEIVALASGGSEMGLRTLCMAYKVVLEDDPMLNMTDYENDLILICAIGLSDTIRPEVPDAIKQCRRAGTTSLIYYFINI